MLKPLKAAELENKIEDVAKRLITSVERSRAGADLKDFLFDVLGFCKVIETETALFITNEERK